jgi:hypothetical protein
LWIALTALNFKSALTDMLSWMSTGGNIGLMVFNPSMYSTVVITVSVYMALVTVSCAGLILGVVGSHQVCTDVMQLIEGVDVDQQSEPEEQPLLKFGDAPQAAADELAPDVIGIEAVTLEADDDAVIGEREWQDADMQVLALKAELETAKGKLAAAQEEQQGLLADLERRRHQAEQDIKMLEERLHGIGEHEHLVFGDMFQGASKEVGESMGDTGPEPDEPEDSAEPESKRDSNLQKTDEPESEIISNLMKKVEKLTSEVHTSKVHMDVQDEEIRFYKGQVGDREQQLAHMQRRLEVLKQELAEKKNLASPDQATTQTPMQEPPPTSERPMGRAFI